MKNRYVQSVMVLVALLGAAMGCNTTRSISDSGYREYGRGFRYQELSEFNVLGIDSTEAISGETISGQMAAHQNVKINKGAAAVLVQSGALFPDDCMQVELAKHFRVVPFSGVVDEQISKGNYAKALRLAAARGGYEFLICYWGILEAEQKNLATKTVSWVPIIGRFVPDETQHMRIRLKMVLVDVRTGQWVMLVPDPVETQGASMRLSREQADQGQVAELKEKGYKALVGMLLEKHTE